MNSVELQLRMQEAYYARRAADVEGNGRAHLNSEQIAALQAEEIERKRRSRANASEAEFETCFQS